MLMFICGITEFLSVFYTNTIGVEEMIEGDFFCWEIDNRSIGIDSSDDIFDRL